MPPPGLSAAACPQPGRLWDSRCHQGPGPAGGHIPAARTPPPPHPHPVPDPRPGSAQSPGSHAHFHMGGRGRHSPCPQNPSTLSGTLQQSGGGVERGGQAVRAWREGRGEGREDRKKPGGRAPRLPTAGRQGRLTPQPRPPRPCWGRRPSSGRAGPVGSTRGNCPRAQPAMLRPVSGHQGRCKCQGSWARPEGQRPRP